MAESIVVHRLKGRATRKVSLPQVFQTPLRPDLIRRAVLAAQSRRFQPQGRSPMAGKRTTAESLGVGRGISRMPRVKGHGYPKAGSAALAPGTVGGRAAHPPRAEKKTVKAINKKERRLALRSAVAATGDGNAVSSRGHVVRDIRVFPVVVEDAIQELTTASSVKEALERIGASADLARAKDGRKIRPGKGKYRGRRRKSPKGPLIIVDADRGVLKASRNLPGVDAVLLRNLNTELLAPGAHPGRLTIWSESAFKKLDETLK